MTLIDSHCHPHFPPLEIPAVRATMQECGVAAALAVATSTAEFETVLQLTRDFPNEFFAACGVHPNTDESLTTAEIVTVCTPPAVLAVGETGLDYYRHQDEEVKIATDIQQQRFAAHIEAARLLNKPLIIHTRDSLADTLAVLRECNGAEVGGVFHCYVSDVAGLRSILDLNFHVSFTGIASFKNATVVQQAAAFVPADRYMVETDSPYLAPVPFRGKTNTPGYVRYVAQALAKIRNCSEEQIAKETTKTFCNLFKVTF
ncbi:MAG: TatD family hydrolase [Proteobacteria bacterium]|nr:TatD family hydrolase [Pseudomonadota bacterium]